MDRPGDEVLARPGLAADEDGDVHPGGLLDDVPDLAHPRASPEPDLAADLGPGVVQVHPRGPDRPPGPGLDLLQDVLQVRLAELLGEEVVGPEPGGLGHPPHVVLVGDQDDRARPPAVRAEPPEELEPVAPVDRGVEQAEGERLPDQGGEGLVQGCREGGVVAEAAQPALERALARGIGLDDEDRAVSHGGQRTGSRMGEERGGNPRAMLRTRLQLLKVPSHP